MALVRLGGGIASASGSVGSITFSRNRGGPYIRNRVVPINPDTEFQQEVRNLVSQLTSAWSSILTQGQRESWDLYALNVPLPNPLGEPRNVGGLGMYVRCNVPRLQTDLPRVDIGPDIFNLATFTPATIETYVEPGLLGLGFDNTDPWANEDDAAMLVFTSRAMNPAINFFKGPYRSIEGIDGDGITPPTSPAALIAAFLTNADQRVFVRIRVTRADGRLSSDQRLTTIVSA
jgi:hypothetical protein